MNCGKLCCLVLSLLLCGSAESGAQERQPFTQPAGSPYFQLAQPYQIKPPSLVSSFSRLPGTFLSDERYLHPEEHFRRRFIKDLQPYTRSYLKYEGYKTRVLQLYKQSYSYTWEGAAFMGGMGALMYLLDPPPR